MKSVLEQYNVADFIEWKRKKRLRLNPDFQRRNVWTPDGKSYLIDSLLRGLPMPKVYMRTIIDPETQGTVRDVVDGQQRLRAILDFAKGDLRLNKRAAEYQGMRYDDLEEETKVGFLSYSVGVEQLINASDEDVLEVFARLNSYTVPLSPAELRHARYQGDFKWKVRDIATRLRKFWLEYGVLSTRERLRMLDDQLTAEMFGVMIQGVHDGGQANLRKLYENHNASFPQADSVARRVRGILRFMEDNFDEALRGDVFSRPPQLLILFAVIAHARRGIEAGDLGDGLPEGGPNFPMNIELMQANLAVLTEAVLEDSSAQRFHAFVLASSGTTQRIASRRTRFNLLWRGLTEPV